MRGRPVDPNRQRLGRLFFGLCCLCVLAIVLNFVARLGWLHLSVPGVTGYANRWRWATGAAVFFALAWYVDRLGRRRAG